MADRVVFISWGMVVRGREERAIENFNETIGLYGQMQQDGRMESFDIVLLNPSTGMDGYLALHGTAEQLEALKESEDFQRQLASAALIVDDLKMVDGYTGPAIAKQMEIYGEAVSKVPQSA
ncbi:MAG: hypothetical protein QOC77_2618 [Thermoleophilaceae bacterium]|jgi:hypothetical protein|nr:hypothetical protein [Thermoleophilaceae bacterium]MEA2471323.1 hypothetical protein [Thermoleophilaceae bacterium]